MATQQHTIATHSPILSILGETELRIPPPPRRVAGARRVDDVERDEADAKAVKDHYGLDLDMGVPDEPQGNVVSLKKAR